MTGRRYLGREINTLLILVAWIVGIGPITWLSLLGYRLVFELPDALEIDENNFNDVERTRVYFDEVLGITYHRETGTLYLICTGVLGGFLGMLAVIFAVDGPPEGAIVTALFAVPFAVAFFLRVLLRVDVVTVYGKRTKASMRFGFRKELARSIYNDLAAKIRASQARALAAQPPPPAPAAPEVPLPPPPGPA